MKALKLIVTALAVLGLLGLASCAKKEVKPQTLKIGAIFAVTGPASFLGAPEEKTARMFVDQVNATGGIHGLKLELVVKDSKGSPENAISFAKQLITEDKVFAIVGPSTTGETMAIKKICDDAKVILVSCAAGEAIVNPVSRYVFKVPQKDSQAAQRIFELMNKMGIKKIGVVSSNTGFGKGGKDQLEKLAPAAGVEIVISEVYDKEATDLTGVLTKLKGKKVEAVVNWSIEPAQALVAKNLRQLGMKVPLFQSHGFGNIRYVQEAGEAAEGIIFPSGRLLVTAVLPEGHPQKAVLTKYKADYEALYKEDVSTFGGHAYDAMLVLTSAIKTAGAESEKVRDAIENTQGLVGTAGVFYFSAEDHNGLTLNAFEMLTVKDGQFAILAN
ncbi:MAG: ABC transporter substrate-binding protein [Fibrobacterota bacterium]